MTTQNPDGYKGQENSSIGILGRPYFDERNSRIKYFSPKIYDSLDELKRDFSEALCMMVSQGATRLTMRYVSTPMIAISGYTEARVPLSGNFEGLHLTYAAVNTPKRLEPSSIIDQEEEMVRDILRKERPSLRTHGGFTISKIDRNNVSRDDVRNIVELYSEAFNSYLFNLDSETIESMLNTNIIYVARNSEGQIVSAAMGERGSFEIGSRPFNFSEISEMATLREYRGQGLVQACTRSLLEDLCKETDLIYAEGRAAHTPINHALHSLGFEYGGFLNKHCVISGDREIEETGPYENMTVWYLPIMKSV